MTSPNLSLPYIEAAQAQKEVTHNEALNRLDALVHLAVLDRDRTAPPEGPSEGERYIVAAGASGDWAGQDGKVAVYYAGWVFLSPKEGWHAWVADEDIALHHDGSAWQDDPATTAAIKAIAALTPGADQAPYFTGADAAALMTVTSFARTLLDDPDAATAQQTLGFTSPILDRASPGDIGTAAPAEGYFTKVGIGTSALNATYAPALQVQSAANDGSGGILIDSYLPTLTLFDLSGGGGAGQIQMNGTALALRNGGADRVIIDRTGNLQMGGANTVISSARHHTLRSYTAATLPSAANAGEVVYVSDEGAMAFANGTSWVRVATSA